MKIILLCILLVSTSDDRPRVEQLNDNVTIQVLYDNCPNPQECIEDRHFLNGTSGHPESRDHLLPRDESHYPHDDPGYGIHHHHGPGFCLTGGPCYPLIFVSFCAAPLEHFISSKVKKEKI